MAEPRGKVFRLVYPPGGLPYTEHRTRDCALFAEAEWGWSRDLGEGYVFDIYGPAPVPDGIRSASDHVAELRRAGDDHAHASVYGSDALAQQRLQARETRHASAVVAAEASIPDALPGRQWPDSIPGRVAKARANRRARVPRPPEEVFAAEERRHLA